MKAISDFFRSLVATTPPKDNSVLHPDDFPVTAKGVTLSNPDGKPIAVASDTATAAEIAERLNADEDRKEEDKWSA